MRLKDFVHINPTVSLEKGRQYPFVGMAVIEPGTRYIGAEKLRQYKSGGAKFQAGDTLFARITPCLENGKIAQFKAAQGQVGFGSTEFFVFRHRPNISDPGYVFYLALSDIVRKPAEKSMSGASGRQRADLDVVKNIEVSAPSLKTQRQIAAVLSAYDDLIENNSRRIAILGEMAQAVYREWFVHFRFPGHEDVELVESELGPIPAGWQVKTLGDVMELSYGKGLRKKDRKEGPFPVYGSSGIIDYHNEPLVEGPGIVVGRKGNVGSTYWSDVGFCPIDTTYYVETELPLHYVYYNLKYQNFIDTHAAVPGLNRNQAYLNPFVIPPQRLLIQFQEFVEPVFAELRLLRNKNEILREMRDLLLPRLISGELDVSGIEVPGTSEVADTYEAPLEMA